MLKASVYILTLNEERHVQRALESVKDFAEIIIIDSGSTDKTKDISKAYTDKFISNDWVTEFDQRKFALEQCTHDWVLSLDADEEVNPDLLSDMKSCIEDDSFDALDINIKEYFMGRLPAPGVKLTHRVKFFKKSLFDYGEARVHIPQSVAGRVRKAKGFITHFGEKSVQLAIEKNNKYSSFSARDKFDNKKKPSRLKMILIIPVVFLKYYLVKRHFLSGVRGFVLSVNCAHYAFVKEAKLYELHHQQNP